MAQNQAIKELSEKGLRTQDLLNDRVKPGDGLIWWNGVELLQVVAGAFTPQRSAAGDYSVTRTTAGTEAQHFVLSLSNLTRRVDTKGLKVLGFLVAYSVVTNDLSSTSFTANLCSYVDRGARVVTSYGGAITFDANHDTDPKRISSAGGSNPHLCEGTFATPQYINTDLQWFSMEFRFVQANAGGCQLNVFGAGLRIEHDYL